MPSDPDLSDTGRLLFGAGFVFGVAFTMLVMGVVTATVAGRVEGGMVSGDLVVTLAAGIFFTTVVGVSLFFLAFPGNRLRIPAVLRSGTGGDEDA